MRAARLAAFLTLAAILASCRQQPAPAPQIAAHPHFVREPAWLGDGKWFYPQEMTELDQTGLAAVVPDGHDVLTTDGEFYDPTAMAAAHQTLQLPAIVTVTNLENGRQVELRVNDRGPANPARVIALTPRAAELLQIPADGTARVHITLDSAMTEALAAQLHGGSLHVSVNTDPVGNVAQQSLAPPPGVGQSSRGYRATQAAPVADQAVAAVQVPDRLPETYTNVAADPGRLFVRADDFARYDYALREAAILTPYGTIESHYRRGRGERYFVRGGPYPTVADADAALMVALRLGLKGAHITVE